MPLAAVVVLPALILARAAGSIGLGLQGIIAFRPGDCILLKMIILCQEAIEINLILFHRLQLPVFKKLPFYHHPGIRAFYYMIWQIVTGYFPPDLLV